MMLMMFLMMGGGLIVVLLAVGVIAFAFAVRPQLNKMGPSQTSRTPLELMKARYASGEISREAYNQLRQTLEG